MHLLNEGIFLCDLSDFRLEGYVRRCQRLGIDMDIDEDGRGLMKSLMAVQDNEIRTVIPLFSVRLTTGT